jgi:hypothetical protein
MRSIAIAAQCALAIALACFMLYTAAGRCALSSTAEAQQGHLAKTRFPKTRFLRTRRHLTRSSP